MVHNEIYEFRLLLTSDQWTRVAINDETIVYRPTFMVTNTDWTSVEKIKAAMVPYIMATYNENKIITLEAFTGIVREKPLFYSSFESTFVLTDETVNIISKKSKYNKRESSFIDFLTFGFVTSKYTLLDGLYCMQAGELIIFKDKQATIMYKYLYNSAIAVEKHRRERYHDLKAISEEVFHDVITSLKGRRVILPLSAGYDSRYIAAMLKMGGFNDVLCFYWGQSNDKNSEISRKTAKKLGYQWQLVEQTEANWQSVMERDLFYRSIKKTFNYLSTTGIGLMVFQSFLFDTFKDEELTILTGHNYSASAGFMGASIDNEANDTILAELYYKKWGLVNGLGHRVNDLTNLNEKVVDLYSMLKCPSKVYETLEIHERQAKFVVNTNSYYELLGHSWCMPLYDFRFLRYMETVSFQEKAGKVLYKDFLDDVLFKEMGIKFAMPTVPVKMKKSGVFKIVKRLHRAIFQSISKSRDEYGFGYVFPYLVELAKAKYPNGFWELKKNCEHNNLLIGQSGYGALVQYVLSMHLNEMTDLTDN